MKTRRVEKKTAYMCLPVVQWRWELGWELEKHNSTRHKCNGRTTVESMCYDRVGSDEKQTAACGGGVFIDRLRKTFAGTKSALVIG